MVGGYEENVKAGCAWIERWRPAGVSKSDEWSSKGRISGEARVISRDTLDLEDWRPMFWACFNEASFAGVVTSSEWICSGEAEDDPARRSKSSSLLLSFLR